VRHLGEAPRGVGGLGDGRRRPAIGEGPMVEEAARRVARQLRAVAGMVWGQSLHEEGGGALLRDPHQRRYSMKEWCSTSASRCHTQFLHQNHVLIVCMTQNQLFHTYGQKGSQITNCHE
jgi:hypothetical protein